MNPPRLSRAGEGASSLPRIVLCGLGTLGDILPLVAIGRQLERLGYRCDLLANEGEERLTHGTTLRYLPVAPRQECNLLSGRQLLQRHVFPSYVPTLQYFDRLVEAESSVVVVNTDRFSASNLAAEKYGLPLCRLHLSPDRLASVAAPGWPHCEHVRGPNGTHYRDEVLRPLYAARDRSPYLLRRIGAVRSLLGLTPMASMAGMDASVTLSMGLFPEWFGPAASNWPDGFYHAGFAKPPMEAALPNEIADFLSGCDKPIVFTPGTGAGNTEPFFLAARKVVQSLRVPAIFLGKGLAPGVGVYGSDTVSAPFANLDGLLAKSRLLVHHGGVGTVAAGLRRGVPQLVCGAEFDQPDNGARVQRLGAGTFCPPGTLTEATLQRRVQTLLGSAEVQRQAAAWADKLRGLDGAQCAAQRIDTWVRSHWQQVA